MKAILLSAATGLLLFILCTACLRYRPHNRVRMLGGLFLALLPLLALAQRTSRRNHAFRTLYDASHKPYQPTRGPSADQLGENMAQIQRKAMMGIAGR